MSTMNPFKRHQTFPLRLSPSSRQQASEIAKEEGISLNHFISLAVAEKISRLERDSFLENQAIPASTRSIRIAPNRSMLPDTE